MLALPRNFPWYSRLFVAVDYINKKLFPDVALSMLLAVFVIRFQDSGGPKIAVFDKISIHPWKFCLVPVRPHDSLYTWSLVSELWYGLEKNTVPVHNFSFVSSQEGPVNLLISLAQFILIKGGKHRMSFCYRLFTAVRNFLIHLHRQNGHL